MECFCSEKDYQNRILYFVPPKKEIQINLHLLSEVGLFICLGFLYYPFNIL